MPGPCGSFQLRLDAKLWVVSAVTVLRGQHLLPRDLLERLCRWTFTEKGLERSDGKQNRGYTEGDLDSVEKVVVAVLLRRVVGDPLVDELRVPALDPHAAGLEDRREPEDALLLLRLRE